MKFYNDEYLENSIYLGIYSGIGIFIFFILFIFGSDYSLNAKLVLATLFLLNINGWICFLFMFKEPIKK